MIFFCILYPAASNASEINYSNCISIQDVIERETEEIIITPENEHDELVQLYVSRGESYLLNSQYVKAIEDFQKSDSHLAFCQDIKAALIVAFRVAFGQVVSYDNLGMIEQTQQALENLKTIAIHVGCDDCKEHHPCHGDILSSNSTIRDINPKMHFSNMIELCKHKKDKNENQQSQGNPGEYDDILGPNEPPVPYWCEEVVTGVGRSMDAIACLAPNYLVKITLIGIIEALISRGVICCQAGGFWKACVAPITRKWVEWKNNKDRSILPNDQNLPKYTN
jgi:hypothetical protein